MNNQFGYDINISFEKPEIEIEVNNCSISMFMPDNNVGIELTDEKIKMDNSENGYKIFYTPLFSELKEEIEILNKEGLFNFEILINTPQCKVDLIDGQYCFVDKETEKIIWKFLPITAFDNDGNELSSKIKFKVSEKDSIYSISLDVEDLEDYSYPIIIDPSLALSYEEGEIIALSTSSLNIGNMYNTLTVPVRSLEPVINDGESITNNRNVTIEHEGTEDGIADFSIRNWDALTPGEWSDWVAVDDKTNWLLDSEKGLKTLEVKYRVPNKSTADPQEEPVGYVETIEKMRFLTKYINKLGGEILSVVSYDDNIYIGGRIPYNNDFIGAIFKFDGERFSYVGKLEVVIQGNRVDVYPYIMRTIGSSIYIGTGRGDFIEGSGCIFRYNKANGINIFSLLESAETRVTALNSYMGDIYVGTSECRVYKYNINTQWSCVFDLKLENENYDKIIGFGVLNGVYLSVYDGTNSDIYFYNDNLEKIYTLYNKEIKEIKIVPGDYNDNGEFNVYLQTSDSIYRLNREKNNKNHSVFEQMQSEPSSPWLRSYIDLPAKTGSNFNKINSAATPNPDESFLPTIVGNNGYIAKFNDKVTTVISEGQTEENLNDIEIVMPDDDYLFFNGREIKIDSNDNFYVFHYDTKTIQKVNSSNGKIIGNYYIDTSLNVMFDFGEDDDIIYVNKEEETLNIMDKNFRFKYNFSINELLGYNIGYNPYDKCVYLLNTLTDVIEVYDLEQKRLVRTIGGPGYGDAEFDDPRSIAFDENYFYVVDTNNDRIQKFNIDGTFVLEWGSKGSGNGQFDMPMDVAIYDENIYVTDRDNSRIQVFDKNGNFQSILPITVGINNGQLNYPKGMQFDSNGYFYVVDTPVAVGGEFWRVQKFTSAGVYVNEFLKSSVAASSNLGYIVGDNGTYLESTDDGITYTLTVPAGDPFGTLNLLAIDVNKRDTNCMVIVAESGNIFTSSDGGVNWSNIQPNANYVYTDVTFKPTKNDFEDTLISGYNSLTNAPILVKLKSDGTYDSVETFSSLTFRSGENKITSISYDERLWLDDVYQNTAIFASLDSISSSYDEAVRLLVNREGEWELIDADLGVASYDVYCYSSNVSVVGPGYISISNDNGSIWNIEDTGISEIWQNIFYFGDSYHNIVIGNYNQDSDDNNILQRSPIRNFQPDYENWTLYWSKEGQSGSVSTSIPAALQDITYTDVFDEAHSFDVAMMPSGESLPSITNGTYLVRGHYDALAVGTVKNTIAPNGTNYGIVEANAIYGLDNYSYYELFTESYIVLVGQQNYGSNDITVTKAYDIVDVDLTSSLIYLDEILDGSDSGFSDDDYNNWFFYIVNKDNIKNSLIIVSPEQTTISYNHASISDKWNSVSNEQGWIVDFSFKLISGKTGTNGFQGIKISDGTYGIIFRIYSAKIELVVGNNIYTFDGSIVSNTSQTGFSNIFSGGNTYERMHRYTLRSWGNYLEVYIDNVLIEVLSGEINNSPTTDTKIIFGDFEPTVGENVDSVGKWGYVYYKTNAEWEYLAESLKTFDNSSIVKKIFHTSFKGYQNYQENIFEEDFQNILWAHNSVNTPWVDNVSNNNGWIVEFKIATSDSSSGFYQRARIYDGKYGLEFRFYPSQNPYITILIGNNVYSFTSVNENYDIVFGALSESDIGKIHTFRIEGEGSNLRVYIDNILINSLSGAILSNATLQKFVDFGDNSGIKSAAQTSNWGIIRYMLSRSSETVFDEYNSNEYIYWTYIKEEDVTAASTVFARNNKDLAGWYVITQNETPNVKLYNNKIEDIHDFYTLYNQDIFNASKIKFYNDITDSIGLVNDSIGFNYIEGDTDSDKILLVGRDTENNYAIAKMVRYGHHFDEILYDENYGYPQYGADIYLTNYSIDALGREEIQAKIFVVSRGLQNLQASLYVYNNNVDIKLYKDYNLSDPLDKYNGVPVADFSTNTQKVYIKITYYSPKETLPTVIINQQGSEDETLNTERINSFTFRAEYKVNAENPNEYLDGFASITIQD